ncbi:MAG TPA: AraC family transcriptional regulator [Kofleriaceae bacterium]|nr:AraC family transcriptional regulator [Kofleriaceae bacterium]
MTTTGARWFARELPTVRTAGEFPHDDRGFARQHGPAPYHALHLYDYPGVIRIGAAERRFTRGDLTVTPARVPSRYHLDGPGRHLCVHFLPAAGRAGPPVRLPLHLSLAGRAELARDKLRSVASLFRDRTPLGQAAASAALLDLLLWLAQSATAAVRIGAGPRTLAAVERVAAILTDRLHEPIEIGRMSREVGISRNYLSRSFRARFGVSMARYLLRRRMEVAAHLLETTDLPVSLVGQRVGVADPHHFNKQFRKAAGVSPSAFRAAATAGRPGGGR